MPRTRSTLSRSRDPADSPIESGLRERLHYIKRGLSLSILSGLTGYSSESVSRYLKRDTPSLLFLTRLCFALGVSIDWLLLNRGEPRPPSLSSSSSDIVLSQLGTLQSRLNAFSRELDKSFRDPEHEHPHDSTMPADIMENPNPHALRLVLGPADGQTITVDSPPREMLSIVIDADSGGAAILAEGRTARGGTAVHAYRRILPTVYSWVDPRRNA